MTPDVEERLNFELFTIKTMGFAGYFLIVADFINHGKDIGVFVGPGRGSAAGSAVAYCIGITNIDPIKYKLLFERFLNPDRKSMPDIDTDFDDEGRQKVIDYVVDKYGKNQVAQLITFGTMAAKMSIKDVARVLDLPLADSNTLAKLVPEKPGINLNRLMFAPLKGDNSLAEKENLQPDEMAHVQELRKIMEGNDQRAQVLKEAVKLEGSVRNTGIHAAGIIIAPTDLTDLIPIAVAKDSELYVTQYEGEIIENAGVIKMDFLGLKTLSIIKTALRLIRDNHGVDIDINHIPLEDIKTFELYQHGETNGTFQFESAGMQKYLKELKPDKYEDLIAMNALYRPGPMEYIPTYIARKQGKEKISYDLPEMAEILEETYGVTVYQEQVMLLSQKLANFTKGDADTLRKAMGKKQKSVLDKMKSKYLEGCVANGHPAKVAEKVWTDWEAFAQYAFNKSHSTCYALVAYQTAYLKANYPAEYMCAVLTHNQSNMDKASFFMDECKRMEIPVLGPDINESGEYFTVNKQGSIRFGLAAIRGVGEAAVQEIIRQRNEAGPFKNFFDLVRRVNLRTVNKKTLESLVLAGALDLFGLKRSQYFGMQKNDTANVLEHAIKYGGNFQQGNAKEQNTLFGDIVEVAIAEPLVPELPEWNNIDKLKKEYEVCGMYLSGHPLDEHRLEVETLRTCSIADMPQFAGRSISLIGLVSSSQTRTTKTGDKFMIFTIEDYSGNLECMLFKEMYVKFKHYAEEPGYIIHLKGTCQPGYRDKEKLELRIQEVELLSETRAKKPLKVKMRMSLDNLDQKSIQAIGEAIKTHPGSDRITLEVVYDQMAVPFRSVNGVVQVNKALIKSLSRFGDVQLGVA
jgi:DNA polymerase-3 subunit alpha